MTYWHTHSSEKGQKHHIYQIFHYFPDYVLLVKKTDRLGFISDWFTLDTFWQKNNLYYQEYFTIVFTVKNIIAVFKKDKDWVIWLAYA